MKDQEQKASREPEKRGREECPSALAIDHLWKARTVSAAGDGQNFQGLRALYALDSDLNPFFCCG